MDKYSIIRLEYSRDFSMEKALGRTKVESTTDREETEWKVKSKDNLAT